ncbi:MAG TPA: gluconate 2-dehydrogenase subunit 3 family protein [Steroidobacteraceae bacterium]|nr:gluconate 2-dehydrogenase subunit 3 family protein [Steroidobacteraceae bacterium]
MLAKRGTPSWNPQTRRVIEERLAINPDEHRFLADAEWLTLKAVCARIVPQPPERARPAPIAAMIDRKLAANGSDGYRDTRLPPLREAWHRALRALDAEARALRSCPFRDLGCTDQDALLGSVQKGEAHDPSWGDMPPQLFFAKRLLHDALSAYYADPHAWNEIGFGGPASPRGYVRMNYDRRDPWEASEAHPGRGARALRENERVGRR